MLVLTRKKDETLMIGDNITVTILGVAGDQVRIGVNAPRETPVHREEIYKRIQDEKKAIQDAKEVSKMDSHELAMLCVNGLREAQQ